MLNRIIASLLITALTISTSSAQSTGLKTHRATMRRERGVKLATTAPISSATAKRGDKVFLRVVEPVTFGGVTLLSAGDTVRGRVTKVKRPRRDCNDGEVKLKVNILSPKNFPPLKTMVVFVDPDPERTVPLNLPEPKLSAWGWALVGPLFAVVLPVYAPFAAGEAVVHRCSGLGNDYVLPAGATVAVTTTEDYIVEY